VTPPRSPKTGPASPDGGAYRWRFEEETPTQTEAFGAEMTLGRSWFQLQINHTPFRWTEQDEYRWITDWLNNLERFFLEHADLPDLNEYYAECFEVEKPPKKSAGEPAVLPAAEPPRALPRSPQIDHIAAVQVQFMENVFFSLQLDRYANAPDNRGWMNLFRRWGRSATFNDRLDDLRSTFTLAFLQFYDWYLRYQQCRIDEDPIPHPWDMKNRRRRRLVPNSAPAPRRTGGDPGPCGAEDVPARDVETKAPAVVEPGIATGIFLDSGNANLCLEEVQPEGEQLPPKSGAHGVPRSAGSTGNVEGQPDDVPGEPGASAPDAPNE
jgi:hypothetical protein